MELDETISSIVEAVLFDNTLGEMERVTSMDLTEDEVIPVNSIEMYEVIPEFE